MPNTVPKTTTPYEGTDELNSSIVLSGNAAGVGPVWLSDLLESDATLAGTVEIVAVRNGPASVATLIDLYGVDKGATLLATPDELDVVFRALALPLPAHATTAALNTPVAARPAFTGGLRLGGSVTFSGAGPYSIEILVRGLKRAS